MGSLVVIVILSTVFDKFEEFAVRLWLEVIFKKSVDVYSCWGENYGKLDFCSVVDANSLCLLA